VLSSELQLVDNDMFPDFFLWQRKCH